LVVTMSKDSSSQRRSTTVALSFLVGIAHHVAAFVPNGVQMPPVSCAGKNGRSPTLITNVPDQAVRLTEKQRFMSTEEITLVDVVPMVSGPILEDVDGIGEVLNQENDDSMTAMGTIVPREEVEAFAASSEEIAQQILDTLPTESLTNDIFPQAVMNEEETTPDAPGLRKILKFAVPAIGVWLCSPILSLIDTSSVGLLAGTAQQAALNPAVAVTDYAALLVVRWIIFLLDQAVSCD